MLPLLLLLATALTPSGGLAGAGTTLQEQQQQQQQHQQLQQLDVSEAGRASATPLWQHSSVFDGSHKHVRHKKGEGHAATPYFHEPHQNASTVTAQLGATAYLTCRVSRLDDKTVSWVRRENGRDEIKLLTWGLHTYSNDDRYSLCLEQPNNWQLQIKYTQRRDAGTYECQISTHPPIVLLVHLNIVSPVVDILDERGVSIKEQFYKSGSTIELECTISQMPQAQTFILWRHGDHMLNYDTSRGGISVKTDMSSSVIVSTLSVANATSRDTGNYTCSLGDVATGRVFVHVLNGEQPQAMHGSSRADLCCFTVLLLSLLPPLLTLLR
ncbi:uncharacterized protein LOC126987329 isoform X2 [Eriocheir sinensis]|uniref:uncharacterized protein LOC126987329 isoform X2 n=1 Tax=Eriocheir sinensis TaxID=95602 RepID=UPI0021C59342|nr:uncharacterized protein LOC126987329 isoform X2 [Eriocheir sinensis]